MENNQFYETCDLILQECQEALRRIDPNSVYALIDLLLKADKVFYIGVGRVLFALQAMGKRLNHLGIKTYQVGEVNEPAITAKDVLIVGSGSGESLIPVAIAKKAKSFHATIVHIGSNPESSLKSITDLMIRIPVQTKLNLSDELPSKQPMTSIFDQALFLFSDALSAIIVERKGLDIKTLWAFHANLE